MSAALAGIRVLDLSRVLAGPWVGQMLADFGADVIKIERPGAGDESRAQGVAAKLPEGSNNVDTSAFSAVNRGKRSVAVDLASAEGQALVRRLAQKSDILIENFKAGDLARYGLDYTSLSALNPGLIYCSITGFGQTGPYAKEPGYDLLFQAMSGLMDTTGNPAGTPGGGPRRVGVPISDATAGLYAGVAILAALHHRDAHGGEGQHIDLALLDAQIAAMTLVPSAYLVAGQKPVRVGNASQTTCPYQAFACADGDMIILANNPRQYQALCKAIARPDLAQDPRYATNALRVANRASLIPQLEEAVQGWPVDALRKRLNAEGVPCGPINDMAQVFEDPQVRHRGLRAEVQHPVKGTTPIVANPIKFSATPVAYRRGPPMLGEHTREVLHELLGMQACEVNLLAQKGVIA
jgi:crotonobetainyl-CoA:carnitine CoA-transferase CaiB-like acyl-CoA transferase